MSEPFAFGFDSDDIDIQGAEAVQNTEPAVRHACSLSATRPQLLSIKDLLSFLPSRISYGTTYIQHGEETLKLPRRELYDIRAQIMAEDDSPSMDHKLGLTDDDIAPNIYEGGFKTWECSLDLASYVANHFKPSEQGLPKNKLHVVELGAGSALPSLVVLNALLSRPTPETKRYPAAFLTVCDFNLSVLTHSTISNLFLTWCASNSLLSDSAEDDIELTPQLMDRFLKGIADQNIWINALSGPWGPELLDLLPQISNDVENKVTSLVLASETIYSLATLVPFTETLTSIIRTAIQNGGSASGMVAAKQVYFGVGGGVEDFLRELRSIGGHSKTLWEREGTGVGRVVLGVDLGLGLAL